MGHHVDPQEENQHKEEAAKSLLLDLSQHPEIRYLRVQWKMNRWGRGEPTPLFGFYLVAQDANAVVAGAVA